MFQYTLVLISHGAMCYFTFMKLITNVLFLSQFALKCNNYCISLMFFEFRFIKTGMSKDKDFEDSVVDSQFKKAN